jgi:phenylpropionate dioxygenase-like ring-hydroxylating dioxygenase large terminal subunit
VTITSEPSVARSPGVTYQELLDTDTHPVSAVLRVERPRYLGSDDVPTDRYTTRAWHEQEKERLWKRVWQFAVREEEIARPGDFYVYDIVGMSFLVMRTEDGSIKAYPNACLHRGRQLKDQSGHCSIIRCPFHGFSWALDGNLADVPARWDFPHVSDDEFHLPEISVGTWAGFVFINPDPQAEPFAEYVRELAEQFAEAGWDLQNAYKEVHVAKVIHANWKIAQEAFCESYHVSGTHPQVMPYLADTNSQVDIWDNCSRIITAGGSPSPLLNSSPTQEDMMRAMLDIRIDQPLPVEIPSDSTMRARGAEMTRDRWRPIVGDRVDAMSDAELMDAIDYTLFPNFHPWGAYNRIVYRFRPNGDDHRSSIMEILFMSPFKGERPPPAEVHWLTPDQPFSDARELATLGKVFDQDCFNMSKVQLGLESTYKAGMTLGNYQESKVRWLHQKLDEWVKG